MFAKFHVLFEPFWHKSRANRVKTGLFVLTNVALQAAIYFATIPQTDDPEAKASAELANLKALIIPMFANSAQMMIFMNMQAAVCGPLQGSIVQRLLGTHNEFDENVFNNIGSVHTLASEEVKDAIQDLGLHVDNASRFLYIAGTLFNIVPMGLYWRTAERSLPAEARNVLYTATAITGLMCVVQKILTDRVALYRKHAMEEDSKFRTRIQADFRSNDAVVACTYQNAESKILIASTQAKQTSAHRYAIALGTAKAINNIMGLGLMNILRIVVGDAYPEVKGTAQLDTFSIAITFFATALLQIIYSLATDYTLATIGLDKITKINNFLNEIEELNSSPFLDISYEQEFDNADAIVRFSDYTLAIPKQNMSATVIDRINTTLNDPHGTFLYYKSNFDIKKATCERIFGPSGTGKSTMFRSMHGIWPYASGKISFACKRDEIYVMPQDQLFVHGTLLENIYYPYPVPNKFINSAQEQKLHELMRIIGLEKEITRLQDVKNWDSPDLSPGLKKRFNFLRMYMRIESGNGPAPKVILLDEMISGVDPESAACLNRLINHLRVKFPDVCVLFIRHDVVPTEEFYSAPQQEFKKKDMYFSAGIGDYATRTMRPESPARIQDQIQVQGSRIESIPKARPQVPMFNATKNGYGRLQMDVDTDIELQSIPSVGLSASLR